MNDPRRRLRLALQVALGLLTLVVYSRLPQNDFIVYDDPDYITQNSYTQRGLTGDGVRWAFTTTQVSNWHPLTWLSHMLDGQLFGLNAWGHHRTNLLLHIGCSLLLLHLLWRMTGALWRSAFVAAFFAWHPLHVESVAWAAERKDVLCAFFWMLTLLAYVRYVERRRPGRYLLALLAFALALLSKPMAVTLPFVLLLLDLWPLKRLPWPAREREAGVTAVAGAPGREAIRTFGRLCVEKLPFFALTAVSCGVTYHAQHSGHAVASLEFFSIPARIANALVAYAAYLGKLVWPVNLAVFYPLHTSQSLGKSLAALLLLGAISAVALRYVRQRPYLLVGWLWYVGTLVPVIGLVQVGDQALADRYTYLPFVGLGILLAWGTNSLALKWPSLRSPLPFIAAGVLAAWMVLTGIQVSYWKDSRTLFEHARAVTTGNNVALNVLGNQLLEETPPRIEEARELLLESLAIRPRDPGSRHGLGDVYAKAGNYDEAITQYREALRLNPKLHESQNALGMALARKRAFAEAIAQFDEAARLQPDYIDPRYNRAVALHGQRRLDEAIAGYQDVLRLNPNYQRALLSLGNALIDRRRFTEAAALFRRVLQQDSGSVDALNRLAWILSTHGDPKVRNGTEAVRLATQACLLTRYEQPQSLNTLAAAYAETGRFDEAVKTAQEALAKAQAAGHTGLAAIIQKLLPLYRARTPYRDR